MILVAFWQNKPISQKPTCLEVTLSGKSYWVLVYSVLLQLLFSGEVVWPGEIPPGWELEWVDEDAE
jgi:hypothetical protein